MKGFVAGLASGVALMAVMWAVRGSGAPSSPPSVSPTPSAPPDLVRKVEALDRELATARGEASTARKRAEEAEARAATLEAQAKAPAESASKPSASPTPAPSEAEAKRKARIELLGRRNRIEVGKPLPEDIAKSLELEPAQLEALNATLVAEGKELYGVLRAVAAEHPKAAIPEEDNVGVLLAALGPSLKDAQDLNKHFQDPEILMGTKTLCLEELMDPASPFIRIMEGLDAVRGRTLETLARSLRPDQRERVETLLRRSFNFGGGSMSLPENVVLRKPR